MQPTKSSSLHVFDLDHTLITCNISFEFGRHLYHKGWLSQLQLASLLVWYGRHKFLNLSINDLHNAIFSRLFKGVPYTKVAHEVDLFLEKLPSFLYDPAISRIKPDSVVISSSPHFLVGPVCERLGIKEWKASSYEIDKEGKLCHISEIVEGQSKASALVELMKARSIEKKHLVYYTDSILDLPVLEVAGTFIAVRPDRQLKKLALKNQWEIIDEPSFLGPRRHR